jgi:hypothetical protein
MNTGWHLTAKQGEEEVVRKATREREQLQLVKSELQFFGVCRLSLRTLFGV